MAFSIKNGDTAPAYVVNLQEDVDTTPAAINLTSATSVTFKMRLVDTTGAPEVSGACVVTSAASGTVTYEWDPGDTATPGTYDVEFQILWNDGTIETVPNSGYGAVIVTDDLDD
jgi:hypothetical protein